MSRKLDIKIHPITVRLTEEQLIKIAIENYEYFVHQSSWDRHASANGLPYHHAYIYRFGTWSKALKVVAEYKGKLESYKQVNSKSDRESA